MFEKDKVGYLSVHSFFFTTTETTVKSYSENIEKKVETLAELDDPILNLPGVKKMLAQCKGWEIPVIKLLFKEKDKAFKTKAIAMLLGWVDCHNVRFTEIKKIFQKRFVLVC